MAYEYALGDEAQAKAHYISLRVQSLKHAMASSASNRQRDAVRNEVAPDSYGSSTSDKIAQDLETPDAPAHFLLQSGDDPFLTKYLKSQRRST